MIRDRGTLQLGSGGILASGDNRAIVSSGYFLSVLRGSADGADAPVA